MSPDFSSTASLVRSHIWIDTSTKWWRKWPLSQSASSKSFDSTHKSQWFGLKFANPMSGLFQYYESDTDLTLRARDDLKCRQSWKSGTEISLRCRCRSRSESRVSVCLRRRRLPRAAFQMEMPRLPGVSDVVHLQPDTDLKINASAGVEIEVNWNVCTSCRFTVAFQTLSICLPAASLPPAVRDAPSFLSFRSRLKTWFFELTMA